MAQQNYKYDFINFVKDDYVKSDCGDITFYNNGSNSVNINGALLLFPGGLITLTANAGEIDRTIYNFKFIIVAAASSLVVIRKIYI